MPNGILRLITVALSIAVVAILSGPPQAEVRGGHRPPLLPHPDFLHLIGASEQQLLADYYWIQTIQAVGVAANADQLRDVYFYARLTTDLDPNFISVYRFAGAAIPMNLGRETWVNTSESTELLEKGVRHSHTDVYLRILLAYNYSYFHKRYQAAAQLLEETARLPGAPRYLPALATRLYAQAGEIEAGLALARSLYENASDPETQQTFEKRIRELQLEQVLRGVDKAIASYTRREGHRPARLEDLVAKGDLLSLPDDPLGGEVVIGTDGNSRSTALARRLAVYEKKE